MLEECTPKEEIGKYRKVKARLIDSLKDPDYYN